MWRRGLETPPRSEASLRRRHQLPVAEGELTGGELIDDDTLAGETCRSRTAQRHPRRMGALVVLRDPVERPLRARNSTARRSPRRRPSPGTTANRCSRSCRREAARLQKATAPHRPIRLHHTPHGDRLRRVTGLACGKVEHHADISELLLLSSSATVAGRRHARASATWRAGTRPDAAPRLLHRLGTPVSVGREILRRRSRSPHSR